MIFDWLMYAPLWQLQAAIAAGVFLLLAWLLVKLRRRKPRVYKYGR